MVKHIVFWSLKETAQGRSKKDNILLMKQKLENLAEIIPQIKSLSVGLNENGGEYDICLDSAFENMEDLKKYDTHPEHEKVKEFVRSVVEKRAAVDFTILP